ncbi:50S ribosomal protein L13 [Candidatus Peregrinibacteria bacterium]|nr:50S ribosomal protein L13 [Candidatus Peregrinibacteria bacterium]
MNKTTIVNPKDIEKKWYIVDAKDLTLGKLATKVADKLRGKDKPTFSPHMDTGDFVIITNATKVSLSGEKMDKKLYHRHSGFPGGLKKISARDLMERKPNKVVELAVRGMLPKNRLRDVFMKKLKIYPTEEHPHTAQNPEKLDI